MTWPAVRTKRMAGRVMCWGDGASEEWLCPENVLVDTARSGYSVAGLP